MLPHLMDSLGCLDLCENLKIVLLGLAEKADDDGFVNAVDTIATVAAGGSLSQKGLSVKEIEHALSELVKKGRIAALTMSIGAPYSYVVVLDDLPAAPGLKGGAR